jgi:hypothetical protein
MVTESLNKIVPMTGELAFRGQTDVSSLHQAYGMATLIARSLDTYGPSERQSDEQRA